MVQTRLRSYLAALVSVPIFLGATTPRGWEYANLLCLFVLRTEVPKPALRILKNLRKEILTIFQFSNNVAATSLETALKSDIQTRFGTDLNYIAQSILERDFDKAVMIHRQLCVNVR